MPRTLIPELWAEARRLCEDLGLGLAEIAAKFGVSETTVRRRAMLDGWQLPRSAAKPTKPAPRRYSRSVVGRRQLIKRLYKAMDTKLKLMERRMQKQIENIDKEEGDLSAADHERDARAFTTMIKNIAQVKEMQADLDRVTGGQPTTAADAELFAEAERFRRDIAERLARFIPAAG
jgi:hypothetical protein